MKRVVVAIAAGLAAVHLGLAGPAAAQPVTLRFGQVPSTVRAVTAIYLFVAEQKGFLAREGIRLEFIPIEGGTDKMVAALDAGKVDVAQTATPYLIQAELAGSDAVAIAGEVANPVYSLMVRPEITSFADLKGKQIGLSLPVDTISISMRKLLAQNGLGSSDYTVKELVGTPVRFACLKSGECAGVPLGQPNDLEALEQGYRRLGDSTQTVSAFQFQVIAVRRAFAAANKGALVHFVRALADAFRFIRDPANRDEVIKIVAERTGSSAQIARATLTLYFQPEKGVLPRQAELDLKGLDQVIAFMGEGGALKAPLPGAARFVDLQYLRAAGVE
jgi:ABC-type nitrate/sulfonate/bicarbonate transport system substrate-binding protein